MSPARTLVAQLGKEQANGTETRWRNDRCRGWPDGWPVGQREVRPGVLREDPEEGRLEHGQQVRFRVLRSYRQEGRSRRDREVRRGSLRADRSQGRAEGRRSHRAREDARGADRAEGRAGRLRLAREDGAAGAQPPLLWCLMDQRERGTGTRLVRAARSLPSGDGHPVVPALIQSVAFDYGSAAEQDAVFGNERPGYVYGRYGTPTVAALELALAELDAVEAVTCFVTGMAAIAAFVDACAVSSGGRVVAQEDSYGQTRALFERWTRERGADIVFVDTTDPAAVERALRAKPTRLLYAEAIANPLLRVNDIAALAALAHGSGARLAVDATFATPILFRPATLGADVVIHSLTKYVNGHGDVMGGAVGGSSEVARAMRDRTILDGGYLPPHEAWLVIRGMRTLALRVARQCESALHVAR